MVFVLRTMAGGIMVSDGAVVVHYYSRYSDWKAMF